jgi:TPP-dependent pyruvate/acetoin dehydrogenase alpha subunit
MSPADIRTFEADVAARFNAGEIRAPIHLDGGNEDQLAAYFARSFRPGDWVCCSWRSHAKALLAGVPHKEVLAAILAGRSITLCFPEHRVISSAIVGGILPIALGLALGIKRGARSCPADGSVLVRSVGEDEFNGNELVPYDRMCCNRCSHWEDTDDPPHVHCFVGDMTARTGAFHECREYAVGHDLPITFIIEDNGKSVKTDTKAAWGGGYGFDGGHRHPPESVWYNGEMKTAYFRYEPTYPHSGTGTWVRW